MNKDGMIVGTSSGAKLSIPDRYKKSRIALILSAKKDQRAILCARACQSGA